MRYDRANWYNRANWDAELYSWSTVIQLNLVRSALTILDAVHAEMGDDNAAEDLSKENEDDDGDSQMQDPSY